MKRTVTLALALSACLTLSAQLNIIGKDPAFSKAISEVILDFPNNYQNISGELIEADLGYEHYASNVKLPGSENCVIGRYHSVKDTTASWQALMFRSEEFEPAAKQYRSLYKRLMASEVKVVDGSKLYLNGEYEAPTEEMDFTVSTLRFETNDYRYHDFKIELELLFKMDHWLININVVTRQKDSEVRPDWMDTHVGR